MGAVPAVFSSVLSPWHWDPSGTLSVFFSTSVFHKRAGCLCRRAAPLGCVLNAEAPG